MNKFHHVVIDQTTQEYLYLTVDNQAYRIVWEKCSKRLLSGTPEERRFIDIAPSGYGLHWPLLDEDLAIDPLLKHAEPIQIDPTGAVGEHAVLTN